MGCNAKFISLLRSEDSSEISWRNGCGLLSVCPLYVGFLENQEAEVLGRVCNHSASSAGSVPGGPLAARDTRPALRVSEGRSDPFSRGGLGTQKQTNAYFYFLFL